MMRSLTAAAALLAALPAMADPNPADWDAVLAEAQGQTVYWNAWGGSPIVNDYIAWIGEQVAQYGVTLEHVKLSDTAEAVSRVLAEKGAGQTEGGAIDLIWINGENFASMKRQGLLFGPWAEALPNWSLVDVDGKPAVTADFTVPTDGLESPWGMAQLVFFHDTARLAVPPRSMAALGAWVAANPGRFAFPQPPDFHGSTFLKQALIELTPDPSVLAQPVSDETYGPATEALWSFMEALTPNLWRQGKAYPQDAARQIQLLADNEIDIGFNFNPNEASNAIANFQLPDTVRSYVHDGGTLGNASFVAIPFNANAKAGAMVVANTLLSPQAQARMMDPAVWGVGTVLDPAKLGATLPEPHPSWMVRLEEDWTARFGVAQ